MSFEQIIGTAIIGIGVAYFLIVLTAKVIQAYKNRHIHSWEVIRTRPREVKEAGSLSDYVIGQAVTEVFAQCKTCPEVTSWITKGHWTPDELNKNR